MSPVTDDMPGPRLDEERRALVEAFAPRVPLIARGLQRQLGLRLDDSESAGYEALTRAALRYDPAMGTPFGAFAYYRVRGAMIDAARNAFPDHKRARRLLHVLGAAQELAEPRGRGPDDARPVTSRCREAHELVWATTAAVLLSRALDDDDEVLGPEARLSLRALVAECDAEETALIDAVYVRGLTMTEYAAAQGTSVSTISRRHQRLLRRLGDRFAGRPRAEDDP